MALTLRYYSEFISRLGKRWRIEIYQQHTGTAAPAAVELSLPADNPLLIEWDETAKTDPLRPSRATLTVVSPGDRTLIHLYATHPGTVRMDVKLYSPATSTYSPYWRGWLDPEQYEEPYTRPDNYEATLVFCDMGMLARTLFEGSGIGTEIGTLIDNALAPTGVPTEWTGYMLGKQYYKDCLVAAENFYTDDGPMTQMEVLDALLRPYTILCRQAAGVIHLCRMTELAGIGTAAIHWEATDQQLSLDRSYKECEATFHVNGFSTLLPEVEAPSGINSNNIALLPTWLPADAEGQPPLYLYLIGGGHNTVQPDMAGYTVSDGVALGCFVPNSRSEKSEGEECQAIMLYSQLSADKVTGRSLRSPQVWLNHGTADDSYTFVLSFTLIGNLPLLQLRGVGLCIRLYHWYKRDTPYAVLDMDTTTRQLKWNTAWTSGTRIGVNQQTPIPTISYEPQATYPTVKEWGGGLHAIDYTLKFNLDGAYYIEIVITDLSLPAQGDTLPTSCYIGIKGLKLEYDTEQYFGHDLTADILTTETINDAAEESLKQDFYVGASTLPSLKTSYGYLLTPNGRAMDAESAGGANNLPQRAWCCLTKAEYAHRNEVLSGTMRLDTGPTMLYTDSAMDTGVVLQKVASRQNLIDDTEEVKMVRQRTCE